jgi:hypothetical protein
MENEERSIASLPQQAQELLLDHTNCLDELKVLTTGFHPMKIYRHLARTRTWNCG